MKYFVRPFRLMALLAISLVALVFTRGADTGRLFASVAFYSDAEPSAEECENDIFCGTPDPLSDAVKKAIGAKPGKELLIAREVSEEPEQCTDGIDNDGDGLTDCADSDCSGQSCGNDMTCQAGACTEEPIKDVKEKEAIVPDTEVIDETQADKEQIPDTKKIETGDVRPVAGEPQAKPAVPEQTGQTDRGTVQKTGDGAPAQTEKTSGEQDKPEVAATPALTAQEVAKLEEKLAPVLQELEKKSDKELPQKEQKAKLEDLTLTAQEAQEARAQLTNSSEVAAALTKPVAKEELQERARARYGLSLERDDTDSDGDGISDALEIKLGSNPKQGDSDGDGIPDGQEISSGTSPITKTDKNTYKIPRVAIPASRTYSEPPSIPVVAPAGARVTVKIFDANGNVTVRKVDISDSNKSLLDLEGLFDGAHTIVLETRDADGTVIQKSEPVVVNIDSSKAKPRPRVIAPSKKPALKQIVLKGQAELGALVEAHFQSVVMTSMVLADSETGEFELTSPPELEPGAHEVTIYGTKDDVASKKIKIEFTLTDKALAASPDNLSAIKDAEKREGLSMTTLLIGGGVIVFGIIVVAVALRRKDTTPPQV